MFLIIAFGRFFGRKDIVIILPIHVHEFEGFIYTARMKGITLLEVLLAREDTEGFNLELKMEPKKNGFLFIRFFLSNNTSID